MYLTQEEIQGIKTTQKPLEVSLGYNTYVGGHGRWIETEHQRVYHDADGCAYDVDYWTTRSYIVGNQYKIQEIGKKANIGITIKVLRISENRDRAKIYYTIVEDNQS